MLLYYSPTSPYVRKVLVAARELGIENQIKAESCSTNPLIPSQASHAHLNPSAKIPTLVSDSGKAYFGSQNIIQYLDHVAGGNKIISQTDIEARLDALTLEAIADGMLDAALLVRYETLARPEQYRWNEWTKGQTQKILLGLKSLSDRLPGTGADRPIGAMLPDPTLPGPLPLEGIAAACALWYLDLRFNEIIGWRDTKEGAPLKEWYAEIQKRSSWNDEKYKSSS
ncbi:hypothetical protein FRB94_012079 [Tulasnella sp. JGI-2019a]|nr:hypothetical protein FRB94_012079 [Tulasnella sp. JGI-2019a]KAG9014562.1 hypothetical protein FRB93_013687 [Tulasnella sp. JGI-2019a]KAG9039816.1 hypothetical protein FRB95_007243 [Tulasnella sp. JGI-2019a]